MFFYCPQKSAILHIIKLITCYVGMQVRTSIYNLPAELAHNILILLCISYQKGIFQRKHLDFS